MKKIGLMMLLGFVLVGCSQSLESLNVNQELLEQQQEQEKSDQELLERDQEKKNQDQELLDAREQVINKFNNERKVIGTGKFIEDTHEKYPEDETIATIYNYYSAIECREFYSMVEDKEWLDKAEAYASKISPAYVGELHQEIIPYVQEFLGEGWSETREKSLAEDEKLAKLTVEDKKTIHKFIEERYDLNGENDAAVWKATSDKFGLSEGAISSIWMDINVIEEIGKDNAQDTEQVKKDIVCDATLEYQGGKALIAVSEEAMDRFFKALTKGNEGTIEELYSSFQVAQVNSGMPVNIIEKKLTRTRVKILDGIFKDNEVWVLMESVKEK